MGINLGKYLLVYLLSTVKFAFGPTLGVGYGLNVPITALLTVAGMMTTVYVTSYFEKQIHWALVRLFSYRRKKKIFTKRNRQFVKIWRLVGLKGVAFLTPVLFTPVLGAILANAVGGKKSEIIKWMWASALFWAIAITFSIKFAVGWMELLV
ncbi:MAG: hypothetical protein OEY56_10785 [Cyclobacteriaceae bacterium]|nr:hypothetical protein [Cyclobacteriaceae bacterium]